MWKVGRFQLVWFLCCHSMLLFLLLPVKVLYIIIAVIPDHWLHSLGLTYVPNKWVLHRTIPGLHTGYESKDSQTLFPSLFPLVQSCRYWLVAVPVYLMVVIVILLVMYMGYSMLITPSFKDLKSITGEGSSLLH